jgi:hypothetical protein
MPANAEPNAVAKSWTVEIDAAARSRSPSNATAITRLARCAQPMPIPAPTIASQMAIIVRLASSSGID